MQQSHLGKFAACKGHRGRTADACLTLRLSPCAPTANGDLEHNKREYAVLVMRGQGTEGSKAIFLLDPAKKHCQKVEGDNPSSQLSTSKTISTVPGSPVEDKHRHTATRLVKGC